MREGQPLFKRDSIGFKLLVYFFILILLPIFLLGVAGNIIYSKAIEDQANTYTSQMIEQVTQNIEFHIRDMENIIGYLSQEPRVVSFLERDNSSGSHDDVRRILRVYKDAHPEIAGIMIVSENNHHISNEMQRIARDSLCTEAWYRQAIDFPKTTQLFSNPIGRNITTNDDSTDEVISVVKAVTQPITGKLLGVILIDVKLDIFKKIIESTKLGKTGFVYVMDTAGNVVYAPVNPIVYRLKQEWFVDSTNTIMKTVQGSTFQIIYKKSSYTGWKTIGVFSLNETLREIATLRYYSVLIAIITLILAAFCALYFAASIARPLGKLSNLMKKAEKGDLSVRFHNKTDDEIGQLGQSFNNMIQKISSLIALVYQEQKLKREAELKTLQAQIKPHFLYNTLDTIHWMAEAHGAKDIVRVVAALANLFRIGLSKGKEMISVGEELEHIRSYLIIQKTRYEDKLEYEIHFDKDVLRYLVPKLIIQPLVENAIYHGIHAKRGGGKVTISAKVENDKIYFCITDNGIGMTAEKVQEIRGLLESKNDKNVVGGYGTFSVNERIKLTFGSEYGLKYNSIYGEGTTVEFWLPLICG